MLILNLYFRKKNLSFTMKNLTIIISFIFLLGCGSNAPTYTECECKEIFNTVLNPIVYGTKVEWTKINICFNDYIQEKRSDGSRGFVNNINPCYKEAFQYGLDLEDVIIRAGICDCRVENSFKEDKLTENKEPIIFSERKKTSFKLFKNNKILLGQKIFSDILKKNSQTLSYSLSNFEDSIIIVEASNNYKYRYFIGVGSRFKVISWSEEENNWIKSQEKITKGIVDLTMNHDDFINYNKNQIKHEVIVNANIQGTQYEVYPEDIRCELSQIGVVIMQNSIVNFSFNNSEEYFFDTTTFLNFFPDSDLVRSIERDIANLTKFLAEDIGVTVLVDSFESQITSNENKLDLYKNILDNPLIKDNAKKIIFESIENGIITEEDIINLISDKQDKSIKKIHVKRLIRSKNKAKN